MIHNLTLTNYFITRQLKKNYIKMVINSICVSHRKQLFVQISIFFNEIFKSFPKWYGDLKFAGKIFYCYSSDFLTGEQFFQKHQILHSCTRFCQFWEVKIFQKIHNTICMLFLNKPENVLKKVQTRRKKWYKEPSRTMLAPLH